jgi:hypothetical protein
MIIVSGEQPLPAAPETHDPDFVTTCSFCGYDREVVGDLVIGPRVSICHSCVDVVVAQRRTTEPEPQPSEVIELQDKMEVELRQDTKTK